MTSEEGKVPELAEIADVNHYDSRVFVQFADGRSVVLTGQQILDAASRCGLNTDKDLSQSTSIQSP